MHRLHALGGAVACALSIACEDSTEPRETFSANLTTAAEVPPVTNAPNASGTATFTLRGGVMEYAIDVSGLTGPSVGAHIHGPAAVGVPAGIIVGFSGLTTVTAGRLASGTFTTATAAGVSFDSVLVLMRNGNAYLNVHTALNPGGEIRGQITRP